MNRTPLKLTLAAALLLGTAASALAQTFVNPDDQARYEQQQQDYQNKQQDYQAKKQAYEESAAAAQANRDTYAVQRDRYANDRAAYEEQRADYDAQYGPGSWERRYSTGYDYRRHDPDADYDHYYRGTSCERRADSSAAAGGVIGALAGAAIGSSLAEHGSRGEGAVLGALAGGAIGAGVGASSASCDAHGYYFSRNQTYAYREADFERGPSGRHDYDYYNRMECRLAIAPAYDGRRRDYRYVRVCPDVDGRYRITG